MFHQTIRSTALDSAAAQWFFGRTFIPSINISNMPDNSLSSTIRYFLFPKRNDMPDVNYFECNVRVIGGGFQRYKESVVRTGIFETNKLIVMDWYNEGNVGDKSNSDFLNAKQEIIESINNTWGSSYAISERTMRFLGDRLPAIIASDVGLKSTVVLTHGLYCNVPLFHLFQSIIPMLLPWYFDVDDNNVLKLSESELAMSRALNEKSPDKYIALIEQFADELNFYDEYRKSLLQRFSSRSIEKRLVQVDNQIRSARDDIDGYEREIRNRIIEIRRLQCEQIGLTQSMIGGEDNELYEFFVANNCLDFSEVYRDTTISYFIKTHLDVFDEDMFENVINNKNSYFYTQNNKSMISDEDAELFFRAVFLEQKLKIRTMSKFNIDTERVNVSATRFQSDGIEIPAKYDTYLPNPHLSFFNCFDGYAPTIRKCLRENDCIGVINQTIESTKNVNFGDGTVMGKFVRELTCGDYTTKDIIETPDGNIMNVLEAIEYLKASNN